MVHDDTKQTEHGFYYLSMTFVILALIGLGFNLILWYEDKHNNHGILNAKNPNERFAAVSSKNSKHKSKGDYDDVESV